MARDEIRAFDPGETGLPPGSKRPDVRLFPPRLLAQRSGGMTSGVGLGIKAAALL